jgi:hypothetical protein
LTKTARKQEPAATLASRESIPSARRKKLPVLLVTGDDELWQQIGPELGADFAPKQLDSIDELSGTTSPGPAIILWDARDHAEPAAVLSRLQSLSARCVVIALDAADNADAWTSAVEHRRISALVTLPVDPARLTEALTSAQEDLNTRITLLGDEGTAAAPRAPTAPGIPWVTAASLAVALIAAAAAFIHFRGSTSPAGSAPAVDSASPSGSAPALGGAAAQGGPAASAGAPTASPAVGGNAAIEENVDLLIERAQQAMLDRQYIEPAEGSALSLYRSALMLDPANGEARQ